MTQPNEISTSNLLPGTRLGKYDLIRRLAIGGMAEIYLARVTGIEGFEKLVVLKRILPQHAQDSAFISMFLDEARLAATLHHPNIAQVYDIGVEGGNYFFTMEYVHGIDLRQLITRSMEAGGPLPLDFAVTIAAGMVAGLHYAHEKSGPDGQPLNLVHRDVSPSNILITFDGTVKIVDFGIAKAASGSGTTNTGSLKGKVAYMSPEQCVGKDELDRRSDLFPIGTILYEMTVGEHPFDGKADWALLNQIVTNDVPRPSSKVKNYPRDLEKIVLRACKRSRNKRYESAKDILRELEEFARDNKVMISSLALADFIEKLFGQKRDEWKAASEKGAFFVEQHVVKTLVETGKVDPRVAAQRQFLESALELAEENTRTEAFVSVPMSTSPRWPSAVPPALPIQAPDSDNEPTEMSDGPPKPVADFGDRGLEPEYPRLEGGIVKEATPVGFSSPHSSPMLVADDSDLRPRTRGWVVAGIAAALVLGVAGFAMFGLSDGEDPAVTGQSADREAAGSDETIAADEEAADDKEAAEDEKAAAEDKAAAEEKAAAEDKAAAEEEALAAEQAAAEQAATDANALAEKQAAADAKALADEQAAANKKLAAANKAAANAKAAEEEKAAAKKSARAKKKSKASNSSSSSTKSKKSQKKKKKKKKKNNWDKSSPFLPDP